MKRLLIPAAVIVGIVVIVVAIVPLALSTDVAKQRITEQIAHWTGRTVEFEGEPQIGLFPYLTVRLRNVRLSNPPGMDGEPFMRMDGLTGKVAILPLIFGRTEIAEFSLAGPRVNLWVDKDGKANWLMRQGAVGTQAAKGDSERATTEVAPPSPRADIRLGRFIITDGEIAFRDERSGKSSVFSKVGLDFSWPSTAEASSGTGSFDWHGETVEFGGSISTPLQLLVGGSSPVHFAFASPTLRISFAGSALRIDDMQIDGEAKLSTPSVSRLVEWIGLPIDAGPILTTGSVSGKLNWGGSSASFADAAFELDGNTAEGAATLTISDGKPDIQGTLAFEKLDLSPYLEVFQEDFVKSGTQPIPPAIMPFLQAARVDVRVSTDELVMGSTRIGRTAASVTVKDGRMTVDISDALLFGGHGEATFIVTEVDDALSGALQAKLEQIPVDVALEDLAAVDRLTGTGTVQLDLAARGRNWNDLIENIHGSGTLSVANGVLDGINLVALPELIKQQAGTPGKAGKTAFADANAEFAVSDGVASTKTLHVEGAGYSADLAGKAWLFSPEIEARGVLTLVDQTGAAEPRQTEVPFMVTGTWQEPIFLPDLGRPIKRDSGGPKTMLDVPSNG